MTIQATHPSSLRTRLWHLAAVGAVIAAVGLGSTTSARADVASSMTAELQAAGIPSVSVSVQTPTAATSTDMTTFDADPTSDPPSVTDENLLSPDPTNPLPVATVSFGEASVTPLTGILAAPGVGGWESVQDAQFPIWRLSIMDAAKHAIASGAQLTGVVMQPSFPNRPDPGQPDLLVAVPSSTDYPATPLSTGMSAAQVQSVMQAGLPTWAKSATVSIVNWVANERRATVSLAVPVDLLAGVDVGQFTSTLANEQLSLDADGADLGSVIVQLTDATNGQPLFTYAGDGTWGQSFAWASPLALPFVDPSSQGLTGDPGSVSATQTTVSDLPAILNAATSKATSLLVP